MNANVTAIKSGAPEVFPNVTPSEGTQTQQQRQKDGGTLDDIRGREDWAQVVRGNLSEALSGMSSFDYVLEYVSEDAFVDALMAPENAGQSTVAIATKLYIQHIPIADAPDVFPPDFSSPEAAHDTVVRAVKEGDAETFLASLQDDLATAMAPFIRFVLQEQKAIFDEVGYPSLGKLIESSDDRRVYEYNDPSDPNNSVATYARLNDGRWVSTD